MSSPSASDAHVATHSDDEDVDKWEIAADATVESTTPGFTDPRKTAPNNGVAQNEDDEEKAREFKMAASEKASEGDLDEAIASMTKALELAADKAMFWAQRAEYYLKKKNALAAIHDASVALEINGASAKALKVRGTCYRHLQRWEESNVDLNAAQSIDFNETVDALLKVVLPKAKKIRETRRKKEQEAEDSRRATALAAHRAAREKADAEAAAEEAAAAMGGMGGMPGGMGGMPGMGGGMPGGMGGMPGMGDLFSDPEIVAAMQDPDVAAKFASLQSNPAAAMQMMSDPKMAPLMQKIMAKMMGGGMGGMPGGMGGMPGMGGGMPGGMGGMPDMGGAEPNVGGPSSSANDDLD